MAGAEQSGEEMQTGRTNRAEDRTRVWAQARQGEPFEGDAIFIVEAAGDLEDDDDFVNASNRTHGVRASGVADGVGVVGLSAPDTGADVSMRSQVGVLGMGPTGVVGEGSVGIEGVALGRPPFDGLAGAGVVGRGARRGIAGAEADRAHGPGVIGLGGSRDRALAVDDVLRAGAGVVGQGANADERRPPAAGVVGRGGTGGERATAPGVVGVAGGASFGLEGLAGRDTGVFGFGGAGVTGQGTEGPGVLGRGGPAGALGETTAETLRPGVVGRAGEGLAAEGGVIHGTGVVGLADDRPLPPYPEAGETGVYGAGRTGVRGFGSEGRGGVFASDRAAQLQLVPRPGTRIVDQEALIPTVAVDPGRLGPPLPSAGIGGDLLASADDQGQVHLWFCVRSGTPGTPARWTQVLLGPSFDGR